MWWMILAAALGFGSHIAHKAYDTFQRFSNLRTTLVQHQETMNEDDKKYQELFAKMVKELEQNNVRVTTMIDQQTRRFGLRDRSELLNFVFSLRRCAEQGHQGGGNSLECVIDGWQRLDQETKKLIAANLEQTYNSIGDQDRAEDLLMAMAINPEHPNLEVLPLEFGPILQNLSGQGLVDYMTLIRWVLINTALTKQYMAARGFGH